MKLKNNCVRCEICGGEAEIDQITTDSWFMGIISIYAKCADCGKMWEKIVELDEFDGYEED